MVDTFRQTRSTPWRAAFSSNATRTAFAQLTSTATKPATVTTAAAERLVVDCFDDGETGGIKLSNIKDHSPDVLMLMPFGADADNETMNLRVWAWNPTIDGDGPIWVPMLLVELACTFDASSTATDFFADSFFCDTISVTVGNTTVHQVSSPADDVTQAWAAVDLLGARLFEIQTDIGTAESANTLWRTLS